MVSGHQRFSVFLFSSIKRPHLLLDAFELLIIPPDCVVIAYIPKSKLFEKLNFDLNSLSCSMCIRYRFSSLHLNSVSNLSAIVRAT